MTVNKFPKYFLQKRIISHNFCVPNVKCLVDNLLLQRGIHTSNSTELKESNFNKILVANRGEIACRIINTAKKMKIKTVAVYSKADVHSRHVNLADETVFIGPSAAAQSYLNMDKILEAVKVSGAEAVHPGYGFLSENAVFVSQLEKEGIVFIGPSAEAISKLGDKLESKKLAAAAGVNVIPGYEGLIENCEHCVEIAQKIGYPVMIKASAGGGGKGMRIARNDDEAREGFQTSIEEAVSSFGDDRILIEKFIENPRHIEIQVLGDKQGNVIYLNERECSIQRRNQKVIEEAPSMFLDDVTRKAMGEQAVKLCKKICYFSAGTVEFLVDKNRNFYFLEMNTRLQVEHPVTECITGVDLIHEMIRIARGHSLNMRQNDVKIKGCAIESRIYAEDPYKNFGLPSIGRLYKYIEPNGLGIRCDSGVEEGSEISFHYDSMISKLICFGKDRQEAIDKSTKALDCYIIRGVTHNIPLLRDILTQERFIKGDINTNYLSEVYPDGFKGHQLALEEKKNLLLVASALYINNQLRNKSFLNESKLQNHGNVWRNWDIVITLNRKNYSLRISQLDELLEIKIDDEKMITMSKKDINLANPLIKIEINKEKVIMQLVSKSSSNHYTISYRGASYNLDIISKEAANFLHLMRRKSKTDVSRIIKSPMPGLVKSVSCKKGDIISEGQELCTIEAMKMQNAILALTTGKVKTVRIKEGVAVSDDEVLIELD